MLLMAVIIVAFASCGSKKTQISMKPETTTISGDLSECFEIVDQECIVKLDKKGGIEPFATWSVKLRRTDKPFPFADDIDVSAYGTWGPSVEAHGGFGIEVVDENGTTVQKSAATGSGFSGPYSHEDVEDLGGVDSIRGFYPYFMTDKMYSESTSRATILKEAIEKYKKDILSICEGMDPRSLGLECNDVSDEPWEDVTFGNKSIASTFIILNTLISDVRAAEAEALRFYIANKIDEE